MKKLLKKVSLLFAVAMVLIVSCSKEEDKAIEPIASTFTVYKNQTGDVNADALQAQNIDSKGILNFYGAFDSESNPIATKTLTYQKANNDTIVNLIINPLTNRLTSSYFSVKGVKSPIIMKFDYIDNSKNIDVSFYNYNWTTETSDLIYASRIENNNGVVTENPFFASKKNMLPTFLEGTLALGTGLAVAEIVGLVAGTFTLSAAAAPVIAAVLATQIVTYAAVGVAVFLISNLAGAAEIDYPPSNSPPKSNTPMINPVSATSNPTSKLQPSSCVNTQMTFRASMDAEGSIMITEVAGGQSPHTYLVSSGFQQSQVFPNKYKDGSYVVGIKDANGCLSFKLVSLKREMDCSSSTLAVTTTTTGNSATAIVTGGQSPYTYTWSNGSTSATATNLLAGTYTVTVTDKLGCTKTAEAIVVGPCDDTTTPYPTVAIGGQVWMQKNLNVCKYRNGDDIPQVQDSAAWAALTTGAWCYYENNTANGPVYGKLFNWYAVNDPRGLAPIGYHVPSDGEWTTLTTYLGGTSVAGGKMKSTGTSLWLSPNTGASNSSGLTGLPGGARLDSGVSYLIGEHGKWWSSSNANTSTAWIIQVFYNYGSILRFNGPMKYGCSVRCIKD